MLFRGSLLILAFLQLLLADSYNFIATTNRHKLLPGESFQVVFTFTFKDSQKIAQVNFTPPEFENITIKSKTTKNTKNSQSWIYTLFAKDKNITIPPAYLDIAIKKNNKKQLGEFDEYDYDYKSFETKPLKIYITKALQNSTSLYGDFNISSSVDKTTIKGDTPINLTIKIEGDGNLNEIGSFSLNIKDATIYKSEPIITNESFTQKFAILSNKAFNIPSFKIEYIDSKTNKLTKKETKAIEIKVEKNTKKEPIKEPITKKTDPIYIILALLVGIALGLFLKKVSLRSKKIDKNFKEKIESAKDTKEILHILISTDQKRYKDIIRELEDDLYISKKNSLSKKEIRKKIFTSYLP